MIIAPLSIEERVKGGYTKYAVINYADVAALGAVTTGTLTIAKPVPAEVFGPVALHVQTAFTSSDGSLVNLTLSIGDAGSTTRYINAVELLATPSAGYSTATTFTCLTSPTTSVICTFAATATKLLNTITAGQVVIFWKTADLATLDAEVSDISEVVLTEQPN